MLFLAFHWPVLRHIYRAALTPDWSHCFAIPLVSLYMLYQDRETTRTRPLRTCWWGIPALLAAIAGQFLAIYFQMWALRGYTMILAIFALTLTLAGPRITSHCIPPIFYLFFAVPMSSLVEPLSQVLQHMAAAGSAFMLNVFGVAFSLEADIAGNIITVFHRGIPLEPLLNVAEACSGLRMLFTFGALGTAFALLSTMAHWKKLLLAAATVPIAVISNVLRLTGLGLLLPYAPDLSTLKHPTPFGLLMLIPACIMFKLVQMALKRWQTHGDPTEQRSGT